jgi:hypothetical protein
MTFYWPNQQSGRLMFYHDHAYGITRLNVYAGEAAGYLIVDPAEDNLRIAGVPGTIVTNPATGAIVSQDLAHLIPLVIQDKTFVPDPATLALTDPLWLDSVRLGKGPLLQRWAISGSPMFTSRTRTRRASLERTLWADGTMAPGSGRFSP